MSRFISSKCCPSQTWSSVVGWLQTLWEDAISSSSNHPVAMLISHTYCSICWGFVLQLIAQQIQNKSTTDLQQIDKQNRISSYSSIQWWQPRTYFFNNYYAFFLIICIDRPSQTQTVHKFLALFWYVCLLRLVISTRVYFANNVANSIFPINSWLIIQRLCCLLWG